MSKKKSFLYYSRVSVSEGLSTEYKISELCQERFDKELNKKCRNCHQIFEIQKNFKNDDDSCDMRFELSQKEDKLNPSIYIMWKENTKYRVLTDLHRSYADKIFRHEPIRSKNESISNEKIDIYLNSMLNY